MISANLAPDVRLAQGFQTKTLPIMKMREGETKTHASIFPPGQDWAA